MRVSETYQDKSDYVTALNLQGQRHVVEIDHVTTAEFKNNDGAIEVKLVVHMKGHEKALVLNKTNASCLASWYSDETDQWVDKRFEMYPTKVDFGGKMVDAIRLAPPPGTPMNAGAQAQAVGQAAALAQQGFAPPQVTDGGGAPQVPANPTTPMPGDLDDAIPFNAHKGL